MIFPPLFIVTKFDFYEHSIIIGAHLSSIIVNSFALHNFAHVVLVFLLFSIVPDA